MTRSFWKSVALSLSLPVLWQGMLHAEVKVVLRACYVRVNNEVLRTQLTIEAEYKKALIDCASNGDCASGARKKQAEQLNTMRKKEIDDILKCRLGQIVDPE